MNTKQKTEKIICPQCKSHTHHTLLASYKTNWEDVTLDADGGNTYDFLSCNGCNSATLRDTAWCSENQEDGPSVTLYPARDNPKPNRVPKDFGTLPYGSPLESVYRQTVAAFSDNLLTLVGAGVRLLIEGICTERGVKNGPVTNSKTGKVRNMSNLEGKINGMVDAGFISKIQADTLHEIRFLGNDAAHELDQPSRKVATMALDIVEHIFTQVYDQPEQAKAIASRKLPPKGSERCIKN